MHRVCEMLFVKCYKIEKQKLIHYSWGFKLMHILSGLY